jgi:hypothetical protein
MAKVSDAKELFAGLTSGSGRVHRLRLKRLRRSARQLRNINGSQPPCRIIRNGTATFWMNSILIIEIRADRDAVRRIKKPSVSSYR